MKITEILVEGRRLNPAIITMKRGTVIRADHARMVRYPSGRTYLVAGVGPPIESVFPAAPTAKSASFSNMLRDFNFRGEYIPAPWQDDTGWHEYDPTDPRTEPGEGSGGFGPDEYSAHRYFSIMRKFRKIMTINPRNIENIEWVQ